MRHQKKKLKFSRPAKESKRLIRNLLSNIILYEKVKTTESKAKKARQYLDHLINVGKKGDLQSIRYLNRFFYIKEPVKKIVEDLSKRYEKRHSGYSRIIPLGTRRGDSAKIVLWQLVEFDKKPVSKGKEKEKTTKPKIVTRVKSK